MRKKFRERFTHPDTIKRIAELEHSPKMQAEIRRVKEEMGKKVLGPFAQMFYSISPYVPKILAVLAIFIFVRRRNLFTAVLSLAFLGWVYLEHLRIKKNKEDLNNSYLEHFLSPVFREIFPDTEIHYFETLDLSILKNLLPRSHTFRSNCHILFGDDYHTEFGNLQTEHVEKDSEDKTTTVVDFTGQVLIARLHTGIQGHIRVVPIISPSGLIQKAGHGCFGEQKEPEKYIQMESIAMNQAYSIFSTDDFYTRLILDPKIIELLTQWKQKMHLCLYMNEEYISVAFQSHEFLFPLPTTKEDVEALSLAGEYEKIRDKLSDFYALIERISEKL